MNSEVQREERESGREWRSVGRVTGGMMPNSRSPYDFKASKRRLQSFRRCDQGRYVVAKLLDAGAIDEQGEGEMRCCSMYPQPPNR